MFFRFSQTNDVKIFTALGISQMHDYAIEPTQCTQTLFTIPLAIILEHGNRPIKNGFTTRKVNAVILDV